MAAGPLITSISYTNKIDHATSYIKINAQVREDKFITELKAAWHGYRIILDILFKMIFALVELSKDRCELKAHSTTDPILALPSYIRINCMSI